jgi:sodium-coupled neutral amino acid transporter 9
MAFRLSSGTLLFIVGVVYFLLINSTLYPILEFIFKKIGFTNYTSNADHPVFDQ